MDISNMKCPHCNKPMTPVVCECRNCALKLEGDFSVSILSLLSPEDQALVIAFLRSFGSIKNIQKILGVSYPTARARIAGVIKRLDRVMEAPVEQSRDILEQLNQGRITFDEAMERL